MGHSARTCVVHCHLFAQPANAKSTRRSSAGNVTDRMQSLSAHVTYCNTEDNPHDQARHENAPFRGPEPRRATHAATVFEAGCQEVAPISLAAAAQPSRGSLPVRCAPCVPLPLTASPMRCDHVARLGSHGEALWECGKEPTAKAAGVSLPLVVCDYVTHQVRPESDGRDECGPPPPLYASGAWDATPRRQRVWGGEEPRARGVRAPSPEAVHDDAFAFNAVLHSKLEV